MALTTYTITGKIAFPGATASPLGRSGTVEFWPSTDDEAMRDSLAHVLFIGRKSWDVAADGSVNVALAATNATGAQPAGEWYWMGRYSSADRKVTLDIGPFTLTANTTFDALVTLTSLPVTPSIVAQAEAARDAALAAQVAAQAVPTTTDGLIAGRVSAGGSATDVALKAKYITEGATRWDLTKYGVATDGTTLADTAFDALLANMKAGDVLDIPNGAAIKLANRRDISKQITIEGNGASFVQSSTAGVFRVVAGGDKSKFKNLKGVGPSGSTYAANSLLVAVAGTVGAYVADVELENVTGQSFGNGTLWAEFARGLTTRGVVTKSCMYVGQMFLSCDDTTVYHPYCDGLTGLSGNSNSYPISFNRDSTKSLANAPRCRGGKVVGGHARNTTWEALDTHAGVNIEVFGYTSFNTKVGIAFVGGADTGGTIVYGPQNCHAYGCTAESGVSDGSAGPGMQLAANYGYEQATGGFFGCTVIGHGLQSSVTGNGGFYLDATRGAQMVGNHAIECSPHGLVLLGDNYGASIMGLDVVDPWSNGTAVTGAVGVVSDNNRFSMSNVRLQHGSKSGVTYLNQAGVYSNSTGRTNVQILNAGGNDFSIAAAGRYVNAGTYLQQSAFDGAPVSKPTLPSSGTVTAADIRAALITLGLAQ